MNRMPVMKPLRSAESGAPAWIDLRTTGGTTTAARFYCSLFGWRVVARHRPLEDSIGYWVFQNGGQDVGGLAPAHEATWTVYMAVSDVDATARAVTEHGGTVLSGPMTTVDAGRVALCADPWGASFVLWQPDLAGEAAGGEAASSTRYQLACRDIEGAKRFYGAVFGWEARTTWLASGSTYTQFCHPDGPRCIAGMVEMDERWPGDVPSHWMVHVAVADTDRVAARATELGGVVSIAPFDLPDVGRIAVLTDPQHAVFSVLQAA